MLVAKPKILVQEVFKLFKRFITTLLSSFKESKMSSIDKWWRHLSGKGAIIANLKDKKNDRCILNEPPDIILYLSSINCHFLSVISRPLLALSCHLITRVNGPGWRKILIKNFFSKYAHFQYLGGILVCFFKVQEQFHGIFESQNSEWYVLTGLYFRQL